MNGKPLLYRGMADFDDPRRALDIGRHTTIEAFEGAMKKASRGGVSLYGWVWAEYDEVPADKRAPFTITRIHEPILIPFRPWVEAKRRALIERPILFPACGWANCCEKQKDEMTEEHQKTARHFRYWCLQFQDLAIATWPWIKETIAEEVLCEK